MVINLFSCVMASQHINDYRGSDRQPLTTNYHVLYRRQFFKTALCKFHIDGRCSKGANCEHAHTEVELLSKPVLTKTRMCKVFLRTGHCEIINSCPFAHDTHEVARTNSFYKSKMCEFVGRDGGCKVGDSCRYAHSADELTAPSLSEKPDLSLRKCSTFNPIHVDFDDSPDTGYPLKRGFSLMSTTDSLSSLDAMQFSARDAYSSQSSLHPHLSYDPYGQFYYD